MDLKLALPDWITLQTDNSLILNPGLEWSNFKIDLVFCLFGDSGEQCFTMTVLVLEPSIGTDLTSFDDSESAPKGEVNYVSLSDIDVFGVCNLNFRTP
jgi:hypothetical protein